MTFDELVINADNLVDDNYTDTQYKAWFQACQDIELLEYLYLPTEAVITRVDDYFPLPSDTKELIAIKEEDDLGYYEVFADRIYVDDDVELTEINIRYDRIPTDIAVGSFVPDIPSQFHSLYYYYAAMASQFSEDEAERVNQATALFNRGLSTLAKVMRRKRNEEKNMTQWTVRRS
jgi:hypothetical protein